MAEKITSEEAVRRAQQYGAEIQFDETAQSPYFTYWKSVTIPNGDGTEMESYEQHEVWFEDDRSYKAKMDIVKEFGLAGISIWNIMNYNQELVDAINNAFSVSKVY